jgi:hypothetical protein
MISETKGSVTGHSEDSPQESCPGCGLAEADWPAATRDGYINEAGERYCCRDCAEGRECECVRALAA